jgi:hypothetical protein
MGIVEVSHWRRIGEAAGARGPGSLPRSRSISAGRFCAGAAAALESPLIAPNRWASSRSATGIESARPEAHEDRASAEVPRYQRRALFRRRGGGARVPFVPHRSGADRRGQPLVSNRRGPRRTRTGPLPRSAVSAPGAFAPARRRRSSPPLIAPNRCASSRSATASIR